MELTSVLAGERWSDEPACVDPPLAALARAVNDSVSAAALHDLVTLVPQFIGTVDIDPRARLEIARELLLRALRLATTESQQFVMCVALLGLHRAWIVGDWPEPAHPVPVDDLSEVPEPVVRRAVEFVVRFPADARKFVTDGLAAALAHAARVVFEASGARADDELTAMLRQAVAGYEAAAVVGDVARREAFVRPDLAASVLG